tara:strand:+ start:997 stop:1713 length:717 start_codon:yes stop_codon:yes gene_type:complete
MKRYGLLGRELSHSFSKEFFNKKFKQLDLENYHYENYELENLSGLKELINKNNLSGINITTPYKEKILTHLDIIDDTAKKIGSVNTIKIHEKKLIGFNTDIIGFEKSILLAIKNRKNALILGDGGASKAVQYVLKKNNIKITIISRKSSKNYNNLTKEDIINNLIIINTTTLGMYPDIKSYPKIPYKFLNKNHLVYDLVYNPKKTKFLEKAEKKGCHIINGYQMLKKQANEAWIIWQN